MHPDVTETSRTEQRVGTGMSHRIGVRVTGESRTVRKHDATEGESTARVVGELMNIETLPNPDIAKPCHCSLISRRTHSRSSGNVILRLR